jgi:hypothetical protein
MAVAPRKGVEDMAYADAFVRKRAVLPLQVDPSSTNTEGLHSTVIDSRFERILKVLSVTSILCSRNSVVNRMLVLLLASPGCVTGAAREIQSRCASSRDDGGHNQDDRILPTVSSWDRLGLYWIRHDLVGWGGSDMARCGI